MKLELVVRKDVSHVELMKDDRTSLGLSIRDGIQDEAGPVIKKVKSKSLAERSHAVAEGDVVLSLNGRDVMGSSATDVRHMMKEIGPKIDLKLQYEIKEACISLPGVYRKQRMTIRLHKVNDGFGFVLRKKVSRHPFSVEYPVISHIKEGGPAYNQMQEGDRLLKVDDVGLNWLSLADIASILLERDAAEFTFEYNVRVVNTSMSGDRGIKVEINIPITDLGIGLGLFSRNSNDICIGSIRLGSIAERCGVFSEGDVILSVNETDVESLNVAKANYLLRNARKIRKLTFISAKAHAQHGYYTQLGHFSLSGKEKYVTTSSNSIGDKRVNYKHFNTPASTNTTFSTQYRNHPTEFCYAEQVKIIKKFQNTIKHMTGLKQNLSLLTHEAFNGKNMHIDNENCSACNRTQHSVKLCTSCLAGMNVKCAQSMDFLRNIIALFVSISVKQGNLLTSEDVKTNTVPNTIGGKSLGSFASKNMIHSLEETLPRVFVGKPELQKNFRALAKKIGNADYSCSTCKDGINSASLTVQKILLLLSLNDPSANTKVLINQLVYCLLETKVTCGEDSDSLDSSHDNETGDSESENSNHRSILPSAEGASVEDEANLPLNITEEAASETRSNETGTEEEQNSERSSENSQFGVSLRKESAFFKITNITSSDSENARSSSEFDETQKFDLNHLGGAGGPSSHYENFAAPSSSHYENFAAPSSSHYENFAATSETNLLEDATQPSNSKNFVINIDKKILKDKNPRCTSAKVRNLLDTILNPRKSPRIRPETRDSQNLNPAETCKSKETNPFAASGCSYENPLQRRVSNPDSEKHSESNERSQSESKKDSTRSFLNRPTANANSVESERVRADTVDVKITKDGGGFGFVLGFSSSSFSDTLPVPIITAVKPGSASHRVGVLLKKDRVLAFNHRSMVGIPLKDLENFKRKAFSSDHVTLTIEFDVVETEMKFGTFDVVLDKNLKTGLIFQDVQKGSPMVVSGVVKGSAAYRSGQLFAGDQVTFVKCVRSEEFDPVTCDYEKKECVRLTVQRSKSKGIKESPIHQLLSQSHPFSYNPSCNPQSGIKFIVKHTSVRSSDRADALILDQDITLFRDPVSWDFGLLIGENPETGRAYVTDIKPDGPAGASGVIKKFDRIVEVNGIVVDRSEDCCAMSLLTQADDKVDLLIRRLYHEEINIPSLKLPSHKTFSFM